MTLLTIHISLRHGLNELATIGDGFGALESNQGYIEQPFFR